MALPFEEVDISDIDSISVTSTQPSDVEPEYAVEKVLSEERDKESGEMKYLVKWEGYPLHLSTWEPAEHLLSDQILSDWQRDKEAVASGVAQPSNMDLYWEVMEKYLDEKQERKDRRVAKRRRLGLPSRSGSVAKESAEDSAESSEDEAPRGRQKQVEDPTPKPKGVAQKVKTNSNRQVAVIISSDRSGHDSEGEDSLPKRRKTKPSSKHSAVSSGKSSRAIAKPVASGARGASTNTYAASVTPAHEVTQKRPSAKSTAPAKKIAAAAAAPVSSVADSTNFAKRTQPSSSARKSAPSTASAFGNSAMAPRKPVLPYDPPKGKAAADPFIGFAKTAPERQARKLSASNPKSHRFSNLAEENRVRKFSAKEAAPDPSVLGTFNFATNKFDEPAMRPRAAALTPMSADNNLFGRREAPAPARQRSVSPSSATAESRMGPALPGDNTTPFVNVCRFWRNTNCHNESCSFAHHFITCPDWRQGRCPKREIDCQFDHKEQGRDPLYRSAKEARAAGVIYPGDIVKPNVNAIPLGVVQPLHQLTDLAVATSPSPDKPSVTFVRPSEVPCHYWARGVCYKPASECRFIHEETGAPSDVKQITCGFWSAQGCKSKACRFAHHEKAFSTLGPRSEGSITCSYWLAGQCQNDRCEFAHYETGCRSLGPPPLAPTDARAISPGELADEPPSATPTVSAQVDVAPIANTTPVSRIPSLPAPQSTDQPPFIIDVFLEVICGESDDFKSAARLVCASKQQATVLTDTFGSKPRLQMQQIVDAGALRNQLAITENHHRFPTGDIICENARKSHAKTLAKKLQQSSSYGVIESVADVLIVFPSGTEEWTFLTREGDPASSQAALKFILLKDVASQNSTEIMPASDRSSSTPLTAADVERLLTISDVKTEDRIFIMMPPSRADEMQRMAKFFEERFKEADYLGRETKIWTSQEQGRWSSVAEKARITGNGGLLIVHPDILLWEIPHMAAILHHSSFRVFSVGVDPNLAKMERREPAFGCQRLFPMGDVVFVTDEVFTETPERALRIIDAVNKQNVGKPVGAPRTKIAARPGLRQWFMKFVVDHERSAEDPRWMALLMAIWDLCPDDKRNPRFPANPSEMTADLISDPPELLPTFYTLVETDRARATDWIVGWFAGWACMNASKYRRFTVCHEEPGTGYLGVDPINFHKVILGAQSDPRGWAKEYPYVHFRTPDEWVEQKSKMKK